MSIFRNARRRLATGLLFLLAAAGTPDAVGQTANDSRDSAALPSPLPTLGGRQFWTDHLVDGDWRIQQHVLTGHYRLLDPRDFRRGYGSYAQCRAILDQLRPQNSPSPRRHLVVVLHGLGRSRKSMEPLVDYLRSNSDLEVINVSYASTRGTMAEHAASLATLLRNLPHVERISFVAHSMGNLVIRHYLGDLMRAPGMRQELRRVHRVVMLAPPNQGAMLADRFETNPFFRVLWGISGGEIANWDEIEPRLATPPVEFGIIAGGSGDAEGHNPWIDGDDDFVVAVSETRLAQAADFLVLPVLHALIMADTRVQQCTLRFLHHGHFISEESRRPIVDPE